MQNRQQLFYRPQGSNPRKKRGFSSTNQTVELDERSIRPRQAMPSLVQNVPYLQAPADLTAASSASTARYSDSSASSDATQNPMGLMQMTGITPIELTALYESQQPYVAAAAAAGMQSNADGSQQQMMPAGFSDLNVAPSQQISLQRARIEELKRVKDSLDKQVQINACLLAQYKIKEQELIQEAEKVRQIEASCAAASSYQAVSPRLYAHQHPMQAASLASSAVLSKEEEDKIVNGFLL